LFIDKNDIHYIREDLKMNPGDRKSFSVRHRYRQPLQRAEIFMQENGMYIVFEHMQRGITAGQFAAWYIEDELIGSGTIYE
jgi:tRNA-uridine 2-sulfurtransferase